MTRVVVTGANGFIGLHTVKDLLDAGYDVAAVDIDLSRLMASEVWTNPRLKAYEVSITENAAMKHLMLQRDKVLHLAAVARFGPARENPQLATRVNVEGTLNVVQACIEKKAERLVYSSTGSVYSTKSHVPIREDSPREPESIYGLTKKMAEDWIMYFGERLPYSILRYGYVYGEGKDWGAVGSFLKNLSENKPPTIFGGTQTNDFIYIKDIMHVNRLALETPYTRQAFNVGTGRAVSILDVCDHCIKAMNSELKPVIKPARAFDYPVFVYDISKMRTLFNFEPRWNIVRGIEDIVKCL